MKDASENDLVVKSKEGSKEAFSELYNIYKERILNYIYGYIGNFAEAQELMQETFINAYRNIDTFRFECKFSSWLYQIATNLAKNFLIRRRKVREEPLDKPLSPFSDIKIGDTIPDINMRPDEEVEKKLLQEEIQRVIDALPTIYREVLLLCDVEGLSYEEAAEILHCKIGTIASRLSEARKIFRKLFKLKME